MRLYEKLIELADRNAPFALATVVRSHGSTPQKAGAKAIFEPAGPIWGTLGGGCLEAESRARAFRALDDGQLQLFDLHLDDDYGWDDGLICGGRVRVLIEPSAATCADAYRAALDATRTHRRGVLVTYLSDRMGQSCGRTVWVEESALGRALPPQLCDQAAAALASEQARVWSSESGAADDAYFEPVVPQPRLVIAGGGHIGQALARLGHFLGFQVTVVDDRVAFTQADLYPQGVTTMCDDIPRALEAINGGPDLYIVIVTRGHRHDGEALARCIQKESAYLGMIGSRRKALLIRKQLLERGVCDAADLSRLHSPMGLDIGSVTVAEIALSVAAELVAVRRNPRAVGAPLNLVSS